MTINKQMVQIEVLNTEIADWKNKDEENRKTIAQLNMIIAEYKAKDEQNKQMVAELEHKSREHEMLRRKLHNTIQELKGTLIFTWSHYSLYVSNSCFVVPDVQATFECSAGCAQCWETKRVTQTICLAPSHILPTVTTRILMSAKEEETAWQVLLLATTIAIKEKNGKGPYASMIF